MRTITKNIALSGTTETLALELKVQEHSSQTWEFVTTGGSNPVRIRLKSVFTDEAGTDPGVGSGGAGVLGADIQTIDLAQNTLVIVNFDMKLEHVRCTWDDDGSSGAPAGFLWLKATTSK